jgi:hypothetical protein
VKRLLAVLAGVLGLRALLRRRTSSGRGAPSRGGSDEERAEDLRAKLARSRTVEADRELFEAGEKPVDEVPDVDTRRADAHAKARQAIDDLT